MKILCRYCQYVCITLFNIFPNIENILSRCSTSCFCRVHVWSVFSQQVQNLLISSTYTSPLRLHVSSSKHDVFAYAAWMNFCRTLFLYCLVFACWMHGSFHLFVEQFCFRYRSCLKHSLLFTEDASGLHWVCCWENGNQFCGYYWVHTMLCYWWWWEPAHPGWSLSSWTAPRWYSQINVCQLLTSPPLPFIHQQGILHLWDEPWMVLSGWWIYVLLILGVKKNLACIA